MNNGGGGGRLVGRGGIYTLGGEEGLLFCVIDPPFIYTFPL